MHAVAGFCFASSLLAMALSATMLIRSGHKHGLTAKGGLLAGEKTQSFFDMREAIIGELERARDALLIWSPDLISGKAAPQVT